MSERLNAGRARGSVAEVVDAGVDLLPHFEMAAIPVLDGAERPAEWPVVRRRLRAEGIRTTVNRGVVLLTPGDLDRLSSVGMLNGNDELFLLAEWDDEFETFPGRITTDAQDFNETTPLGLEEWMHDTGCLLAVGDGNGVNWATLDPSIAERMRARFPIARS